MFPLMPPFSRLLARIKDMAWRTLGLPRKQGHAEEHCAPHIQFRPGGSEELDLLPFLVGLDLDEDVAGILAVDADGRVERLLLGRRKRPAGEVRAAHLGQPQRQRDVDEPVAQRVETGPLAVLGRPQVRLDARRDPIASSILSIFADVSSPGEAASATASNIRLPCMFSRT